MSLELQSKNISNSGTSTIMVPRHSAQHLAKWQSTYQSIKPVSTTTYSIIAVSVCWVSLCWMWHVIPLCRVSWCLNHGYQYSYELEHNLGGTSTDFSHIDLTTCDIIRVMSITIPSATERRILCLLNSKNVLYSPETVTDTKIDTFYNTIWQNIN